MSQGPDDAKFELRRAALRRRDAMPAADRAGLSARIAEHALNGPLADLPPGAVVAGYVSMRSEVDPAPSLTRLSGRGVRLALPAVEGQALVFRAYAPGDQLDVGAFGTRSPGPSAAVVRPDVLLVPLAAFDRRQHRIGYGGGFYDRAIASLRAAGAVPRTIGLAFAAQAIEHVPAEPFDEALDCIVTEEGVIA